MPEGSPKHQSQSNGEVERVTEPIQGLARTIKDSIEQKADMKEQQAETLEDTADGI